MKRPILIAVIGYIIGIIWGLYFKFSIALLYTILFPLIAIIKKLFISNKRKKFRIFSLSRYFRYIKLIFNYKVVLIIVGFSIISNSIIILKNQKFDNLYKEIETVELTAIIDSPKYEKQYKNEYKIKVLELNNSRKYENTYLYLNIEKKYDLQYGSKVKIKGVFKSPEVARNFEGFNYKEFLKTLDIYGTVNANYAEVSEKQAILPYKIYISKLREKIDVSAKKYLDNEAYSIYLGLILGDTSKIQEDVKGKFRDSNMSHILAVSGMHISYIVIGIFVIFNRILGKRLLKIITIIILILYVLLTGVSPSIIRACIMEIMILISSLIYMKNDTWNSIAISLFLILIYNPYLITSVGLQFSYAGTIGIILLNKNVLTMLNRKKKNKSKIKEIIAISISAQVFILPINILHFNTLGIYFLITNILLSFIVGPVVILGFIFLILLIFNLSIAKLIAIALNLLIKSILLISNLSFFPMSKIYIKTPKIYEIILFYFAIIIINFIYSLKKKKSPSAFNMRIKYMIEVFKFNYRKHKKNWTIIISSVMIVIFLINVFNKKDLKIHFVDVGQGDCCFIELPNNKTILIDGGGSESVSVDVGKSTLIPYILDRGYTKVDYIFISHFDTDHVGGILTVMQELKVDTIIISKQGNICENYEKFKKIAKKNKLNVLTVEKGDRLRIDKDIYFEILWPNNNNLINENILNNNSIVCKMYYKNFSMLFTGDIEELTEKQLLKEYKNNLKLLNSTILKVAHHGSKTSSIKEFIDLVKPKIALIGVGSNNKFGHPNKQVIERLQENGVSIYRTDKNGEISINVNVKGKIVKVNKNV